MIKHSAKMLGITVQGDEFMFDSEEETSHLMDFVLFDYKVNGKNAVQVYRETHKEQSIADNEIIDSMLSSYTSLFEVVAISGYTLQLKDLFRIMDKPIKLIDVSFSGSAIPGMLLFIRLVPLNDYYMTSGVSFVFRNELKEYLVRRYSKISKKIKAADDDISRYFSFFKLSKECGEEVRYLR